MNRLLYLQEYSGLFNLTILTDPIYHKDSESDW